MSTALELDVLSDDLIGRDGGFLAIRRLRLVNRHPDGSRSAPYVCDFVVRPYGLDAVVVAVWSRDDAGQIQVLLRDGLRPALSFGRAAADAPIPDTKRYLFFTELVAGVIEEEDRGEAGVKRRAAAEVLEEAGFVVDPERIVLLGAGAFPSPGSMPERYFWTAIEVDPEAQLPLAGDGSPMEEGATTRWMNLDAAIAACVGGDLEDIKTELGLRRLRDLLR